MLLLKEAGQLKQDSIYTFQVHTLHRSQENLR